MAQLDQIAQKVGEAWVAASAASSAAWKLQKDTMVDSYAAIDIQWNSDREAHNTEYEGFKSDTSDEMSGNTASFLGELADLKANVDQDKVDSLSEFAAVLAAWETENDEKLAETLETIQSDRAEYVAHVGTYEEYTEGYEVREAVAKFGMEDDFVPPMAEEAGE